MRRHSLNSSLLDTGLGWNDRGVGPVVERWETDPCNYKIIETNESENGSVKDNIVKDTKVKIFHRLVSVSNATNASQKPAWVK